MADLVRNLFSLDAFTPRFMTKTVLGCILQSAEVFQEILPERAGRTMLIEFRNKLQAFYLFEYIDSILGLSSCPGITLPQMLDKASVLGPFFSVWAAEGLGHYHAQLHTRNGVMPRGLLSGEATTDLPRHNLVPLHAGMGLALAEAWLVQRRRSGIQIDHFLRLCDDNSHPEYLGATIEALGLVARNLHPDLVVQIDGELTQHNQELLAYFWHGVGRGIYFLPSNSLPLWGYEMCLQEPPDDLGKLNAAAGYAWALTLVNLRQPEIVAAFLKQHQTKINENDAFANGVFAASVIWLESAPQDSFVTALCNYDPGWQDASHQHLWDHYVRRSGTRALDFHRASPGEIGNLFRYQPLAS